MGGMLEVSYGLECCLVDGMVMGCQRGGGYRMCAGPGASDSCRRVPTGHPARRQASCPAPQECCWSSPAGALASNTLSSSHCFCTCDWMLSSRSRLARFSFAPCSSIHVNQIADRSGLAMH